MFVISPAIMAKDLIPKTVSTSDGVLTAQFDLSHMGQDSGLLVKWGDGTEKKSELVVMLMKKTLRLHTHI
tara:strand:+ start:1142 stop:1351 length:210 start_codon:yes stop_codon:yes gene_type:complete